MRKGGGGNSVACKRFVAVITDSLTHAICDLVDVRVHRFMLVHVKIAEIRLLVSVVYYMV